MRKELTYTSSQKKGFIVLLVIVLGISTAITGWNFMKKDDPLSMEFSEPLFTSPVYTRDSIVRLDINLADSSAWASLNGIGSVLAKRIINYRRSLGGFSSIDQISKVYGISSETFTAISPYLMVNEITVPKKSGKIFTYRKKRGKPKNENKEYPLLDVNTTTAAALRQLPGIGDVLSERIIRYRNSLNGFQSIDDLGAVYSLSAKTLNQIRPYLYVNNKTLSDLRKSSPKEGEITDLIASRESSPEGEFKTGGPMGLSRGAETAPANVNKNLQALNLNTADSTQLIKLPGIGKILANRIIKYRNLVGHFRTLDQLKEVYGLSDENYGRMLPYLFVSDTDQFPLKDLNSVYSQVLYFYPSVSKSLANNIIEHRRDLGRFESWDEVSKVSGMTPQALETLKAYFTL